MTEKKKNTSLENLINEGLLENSSMSDLATIMSAWKEVDKKNRILFAMATSKIEGTREIEGFMYCEDKDVDAIHDMMVNAFKQKRDAAVIAISAVLNSHPELIVKAYKDAKIMIQLLKKSDKPMC